jgi:methyl coenzyme M reductase gamma subunit
MYPDFTMYTIINIKLNLFVIEVKPPGPTQCISDQRKVGYEMQKMIDKLVDSGVPGPAMCGVWVDGFICHSFKMTLQYNGIYQMIELDSFSLPQHIGDVVNVKSIMSALLKLKVSLINHLFDKKIIIYIYMDFF